MNFGYSSISPSYPLLGVTHRLQVFLYLLYLLVFASRDFEPIYRLQQINLFIQSFFECSLSLLFSKRLVVFDLLKFSDSPHFQLLVKNSKIIFTLWVPSPLNFLLVPNLLVFAKSLLLLNLFLDFIVFFFSELGRMGPSEPPSGQPLDIQGCLVTSLLPHLRIKVQTWSYKFISSSIDE